MSDIDLTKAAGLTLDYIKSCTLIESYVPTGLPHELSLEHQTDLLSQLINGSIQGEKGHRCFGWCQAALVINGIGDLDVYRMINYSCKY